MGIRERLKDTLYSLVEPKGACGDSLLVVEVYMCIKYRGGVEICKIMWKKVRLWLLRLGMVS